MKCTGNSIVVCFTLLLLIIAPSSHSSAGDPEELVTETVLPNGLKVLLLENHKAPAITFQVWYRVGSRNEKYGKTGISHLLEHMMFRGTERVGPGELSRIIQENGGQHNAFTSADSTTYFQNLKSDRIDVSVELESDRMQNLILRDDAFRTERSVVMEERRLRTDDNPKAAMWEQLWAAAFQSQPYHWPVIGWMEDIARLSLDDVKAHYKRFYNPVNAVLVVVGDFDKKALLKKIERCFGAIPGGALPEQKISVDEPQNGERRITVKREARVASLVMGFHVPNLRGPPDKGMPETQDSRDSYALEVVEALLGWGESSRLQMGLVRGKKVALAIGVSHPLLSRDPSLFTVSADVLPDRRVTDVESVIDEEMGRLQHEPVGERELQKAKNQLEASFVFQQDSIFSQASQLARYEMVSSWRNLDAYLPSIRKITSEDVQRVAKRYLTPDNRTTVILVPVSPSHATTSPPLASTEQQIR